MYEYLRLPFLDILWKRPIWLRVSFRDPMLASVIRLVALPYVVSVCGVAANTSQFLYQADIYY